MSFILDALKKSENERQRQIGPSLADAPMRQHQPDRPWWAFAVAALLVVNLAVLLIVLTRDKPNEVTTASAAPVQPALMPATTPPAATVATGTPPMSASPAPIVASNPAVRSLADEAGDADDATNYEGASNPDFAAASNVPADPPAVSAAPVRPIDAPAVAPLPAHAMFEARTAPESTEVLPTLNDLTARGTSVPELHLDIHVFSNNPAERFVFVNMRKYVEGQTLTEGPAVERITTEGVVLNSRGQRFLLARQ